MPKHSRLYTACCAALGMNTDKVTVMSQPLSNGTPIIAPPALTTTSQYTFHGYHPGLLKSFLLPALSVDYPAVHWPAELTIAHLTWATRYRPVVSPRWTGRSGNCFNSYGLAGGLIFCMYPIVYGQARQDIVPSYMDWPEMA